MAAVVVAAALGGALPGAAEAARRDRTVCAQRTLMYDTPGGYAVGILHRRDRVRVLAVRRGRRWVRVSADLGWGGDLGLRGWLRARALC